MENSDAAKDFLGKICTIILPNQQIMTGILRTDGTNYGFDNGFGFPATAIYEVRKIEAAEEVNIVRAVLVLKTV